MQLAARLWSGLNSLPALLFSFFLLVSLLSVCLMFVAPSPV